MKTLGTIMISILTTVGTLFVLLFWLELEIVSVAVDGESIPVVTQLTEETAQIVSVVNHEEAQMNAIDKVAEAIVGVVSTIDGYGGFLGNFGGQRAGTGSGIVYAVRDGHTYIATNEHVINRAAHIEVVFNDAAGTRLPATLVGQDVYTDIAVLRIENFEADVVATFGRTEDLRLGQTVIAIGNPLGLEFAGSATMGVVSGHDRSVPIPILSTNGQMQNWNMTVLQTDTAINPGNSGGALINLAGEVVGINSMKVAQSAVEGMSFSIPTYIALPIIEDLERYGQVTRPLLGVSLVNLSMLPGSIRDEINLPADVTTGVFVNDVVPESLASSMGIEAGDVLTHIGDVEISDNSTFRQILFTYRDGDEITLTILRNGIAFDETARIVLPDSGS
ncbi:MAG: trypsin-like peptidase domain-containing protein [Defluviitaleaceae bacterium]|nr:trypsin-like peptidase domain-containing protein [Defluviitaleaceae bacterium]